MNEIAIFGEKKEEVQAGSRKFSYENFKRMNKDVTVSVLKEQGYTNIDFTYMTENIVRCDMEGKGFYLNWSRKETILHIFRLADIDCYKFFSTNTKEIRYTSEMILMFPILFERREKFKSCRITVYGRRREGWEFPLIKEDMDDLRIYELNEEDLKDLKKLNRGEKT